MSFPKVRTSWKTVKAITTVAVISKAVYTAHATPSEIVCRQKIVKATLRHETAKAKHVADTFRIPLDRFMKYAAITSHVIAPPSRIHGLIADEKVVTAPTEAVSSESFGSFELASGSRIRSPPSRTRFIKTTLVNATLFKYIR